MARMMMKLTGRRERTPRMRRNIQRRVKRKSHTEKDQRRENHTVAINHINTRKIKKGKRKRSTSTVKEKKKRSPDPVVVVEIKIRSRKESPLTRTGIVRT